VNNEFEWKQNEIVLASGGGVNSYQKWGTALLKIAAYTENM
jgi:hypothetical protein